MKEFMENFQSLGLNPVLLASLEAMSFTTPTPIQAQAIPPALEGKDILGSAQTGTGKTAAFGIPLVSHLLSNSRSCALIMTPTRELADQVLQTLGALLGKNSNIKTALLIGGDSMPKQLSQLRARPRLIVGTPGRINDHLERGSLMLHTTDFLVLDETDRMLDMGFTKQIEKIVKFLPAKRQTLLFSATMPHNIQDMSKRYLTDPVRITVETSVENTPKISQDVVHVNQKDKYEQLVEQLEKREGSVIVFMKTKWNAKKMAMRLHREGHSSEAIHGDLSQNARTRVINHYRDYKFRVLVATDIAARGLDIPHIEHVINYDLPQCPEDYIHRIGRTARAGAEGSAVCFLTPDDRRQWNEIQKLMDPNAKLEAFERPQHASPAKPKSRSKSRSRHHRRGNAAKNHVEKAAKLQEVSAKSPSRKNYKIKQLKIAGQL